MARRYPNEMSPSILNALFIAGSVLFASFGSTELQAQQPTVKPEFVGTETCRNCHEDQYKDWSGSHHDWAIKKPTPETVLGDFDDAVFESGDVRFRFFRKDEEFLVETSEPVEGRTVFAVKFAVGVEPLQQYLVELARGRLQALDVAWDADGKRWFDLYPDDASKPGDGLHWSGPYKNWQARCASCHQTDFSKNYDPRAKTYTSEWKDLSVGCESCHGAGSSHTAWAQDPVEFEKNPPEDVNARGLLVSFLEGKEGQKTELDTCAGCHSRREAISGDSPPAGSDFDDHYNLATLRNGLYHADGQIDDEVYVYGSFLQSKMFAAGVKCSNCHEPHSARLKASGNAVCTQCHNETGRADFASLKPSNYESPEHHRHKETGAGAQCVSCHMVSKNYMVVDPRRDHSFRVPRPDLTETLGVPNACTSCHQDKSAQWAAKVVADWYPSGRSGSPHFSQAIFRARTLPPGEATDGLVKIAVDESVAAIVRATAIAELRRQMTPAVAKSLLPLLKDENAMIRVNTIRAFEGASAGLRGGVIAGMMADPIRSVRIAAVRATLGISTAGLDADALAVVKKARLEFQNSMRARTDFPETHMQMAGLAMSGRNMRAADAAFSEALLLDPQLTNAWSARARMAMVSRQPKRAEKILMDGLKKNPDSAPIYQSLAGIFVQSGKLQDALKALENAKKLDPEDPITRLDIARIQSETGNHPDAIRELEILRAKGGANADALELLVASLVRNRDKKRALEIVADLRRRFPSHLPVLEETKSLWDLRR